MNGVQMDNYIDDLYRRAMASQGRMPANAAFDQVLRTGKPAPPGTDFVDLSDEQVLAKAIAPNYALPPKAPTAMLDKQPIELPPKYKVQVPQSEIIRLNRNQAIEDLQDEAAKIEQNISANREQYGSEKDALRDAITRMRSLGEDSYKSPEIDALIQAQAKKMEQAPDVPERDFLSEAILNLGPALGAMFLGEAGAKAAPTTFTQARSIYETGRKEQIDRVKLLREDTEKKLKAAIDLKKSGQESFDKSQQRQIEKAKTEVSATKDLAQMSGTELEKEEQRLGTLNQEISRQIGTGATDVAKMERSQWVEQQKNKRTPRMIKQGEVAGEPDFVPGWTWNKKTPINKPDVSKLQDAVSDRDSFNSIMQKVTDKVANANELELVNPFSEVRRSIESDLADAQLLYKGESFAKLGVLTGPDVKYLDMVLDPPTFTNTVTRGGRTAVVQRYKEAIDRVNSALNNKMKSRGFSSNQKLPTINIPEKKKEIKDAPKGMSFEEFKKWKREL